VKSISSAVCSEGVAGEGTEEGVDWFNEGGVEENEGEGLRVVAEMWAREMATITTSARQSAETLRRYRLFD
jgi:hypothetical protein